MSRRRFRVRRNSGVLFAIIVLVGVMLVSGIPYFVVSKSDRLRPPVEAVPVHLDLPPGVTLDSLEKGRIDNVVDGDTIDVSVNGRVQRVRYYGVDTPERGDKCFREATDRNTTLIGKDVLLLSDRRLFDRFDRVLRYIFLPDGTSVDATLVAEGFGHAWREDGRYKDQIIQLEAEAQAAGRGCLWKSAG